VHLDLVNLLLILLVAWLAGNLAERFRYPSVLGELLAGIILGPPLLGFLHGSDEIAILAELGVLLMMLYIGMEIDPGELAKASWAGFLAAMGGFITPFVLAYFTVIWFDGTPLAGLFVGIAAAITSLATKSRILVDLHLLDTRVAHVLMAGALISDTLALVVFAAIMGVVDVGSIDLAGIGLVTLKATVFFAVTVVAGHKLFPWVGRRLTEAGLTGRTFHFTLVLLIAVSFAELAELAGLHSILGAFIAGLFIRDNVLGRSLARDLMRAVREASLGFLAPIFFVTAGFLVSFRVFTGTDLGLFLAIMVVAVVGKIVGTALFYLPSGHGWREGLTVGMGMNGRGAVEIIVAGIALERGLISQEIFSILVFMAIFTTAMVPVMLKWGVEWLRGRGELVRAHDERRGTVIVGSGPLGRLIGRMLSPHRPVWMLDSNPERCEQAERDGLQAFCGNALQEQALSEAGAPRADSLIALTTNPEVNALAARIAREVFDVPEVYVVQVQQEVKERDAALRHLHASSLFGGSVARGEWERTVAMGAYRETEVEVEEPATGEEFAHVLREQGRVLPVVVRRDDDAFPFHAGFLLRAGDRVVVLRRDARREELPAVFRRAVRESPVLDLEGPISADEFFEKAAAVLTEGATEAERLALLEALRDREAAGSTVLAPGIAVPHIVAPVAGALPFLIARCRDGIMFPDEKEPVHSAFVLVRGAAGRGFHLQALAAIAAAARRDDFEERWMAAGDAEALRSIVL
jgi:Kef-type K+ transport system membrane component KefB/Trk K+ transport system NAD-binding subunit/mannitol/fructose-specific phosphotransferase system IIA component (Ntr-type)